MRKLFGAIGSFLCGTIKFCKNIVSLSFLFCLIVFILTVFMPENVKIALEIFKNLLKIP